MRAGLDLFIWMYLDSYGSAKADPNGEKLEKRIEIGLISIQPCDNIPLASSYSLGSMD